MAKRRSGARLVSHFESVPLFAIAVHCIYYLMCEKSSAGFIYLRSPQPRRVSLPPLQNNKKNGREKFSARAAWKCGFSYNGDAG
jgi:hypothetical protein